MNLQHYFHLAFGHYLPHELGAHQIDCASLPGAALMARIDDSCNYLAQSDLTIGQIKCIIDRCADDCERIIRNWRA